MRALLVALMGHSMMCVVFLAHELSHGAILKRSRASYLLEVVLWGVMGVPATMWRRVHNEMHHAHASTLRDPDRFFVRAELDEPGGRLRWAYARFFMPHRQTSRLNPLVRLHFLTYVARHLLAVLYPSQQRPSIVTAKPDYRKGDRLRIALECLLILGWQVVIYLAVGRSALAWLWAGPGTLMVTSCFAMSYIWTNHYLHGLGERHDPLLDSTSVAVPRLLDTLHSQFSFHTEHHLFPTMSGRFYPMVSKILMSEFPDRYERLPCARAWEQLWLGEPFAAPPGREHDVPSGTSAPSGSSLR